MVDSKIVKVIGNQDVPIKQKADGTLYGAGSGKTLKSMPINANAAGDNAIIPAVLGMRIKVYAVTLIVSAAVNVYWKSGANVKTGTMQFGGMGQGYALAVDPPEYLNSHSTNVGEDLILNLSGAVAVSGFVDYWDSDPS